MKIRNLIALFFFFWSYSINAQDQHVIDSLTSVIEKAKHDTLVCAAYLSWGEQVYLSNPDTALILWQRARDIAEQILASEQQASLKKRYSFFLATALHKIGRVYQHQVEMKTAYEYYQKSLIIREEIGDKFGAASALNNIGNVLLYQGDMQGALECYQKSFTIKDELGDNGGMANSLNNIGLFYQNQGSMPTALEYYLRSLKIKEEIGDKFGAATSLNNIGNIYFSQKDYPSALDSYKKSLKIREEIDYKEGAARCLNNIGNLYQTRNELHRALGYYQKSLVIREAIGDKMGLSSSLNNIGNFHQAQDSMQLALEYYQMSLKIKEEIGEVKGQAETLNNIANVYLKTGAIQKAKEHGQKGMKLAKELGTLEYIRDAVHLFFKIHRVEDDYKQALEMYEMYIELRDSVNNEETQKSTIRQQTKYEFEKAQLVKEQEEKEQARLEAEVTDRRDNLQYSVIIIAIVALILAVLALSVRPLKAARPFYARLTEGLVFFTFLILFEFLLVLTDPYIDSWSGGAPGIKLLFNAGIAALIFPMHSFFESKLKGRLVP